MTSASLVLLFSATMAKASGSGLTPPPQRPEAPSPVDGECEKVYAVRVGEQIPTTKNGVATCSGDLVPTSQLADLLATEAWAVAMRDYQSISETYYLHRIELLESELEWTQAQLQAERRQWWLRPWVQRSIGGAAVLGTVLVAAYGLQAVQE